jgi:hypothetical protein
MPKFKAPARNRKKTIIIIIVLVAVVGGSLGYLALSPILNPRPPATVATWTQWGMSIQHPPGLVDKYTGLLENYSNTDSGGVAWTWNGGNTSLALFWLPDVSYDYNAGFQGIESDMATSSSSITLLTSGNVTVDAQPWVYRTYSAETNGSQYYWVVALCFYANEFRVYSIQYFDTSQDVLDPMLVWANTFKG